MAMSHQMMQRDTPEGPRPPSAQFIPPCGQVPATYNATVAVRAQSLPVRAGREVMLGRTAPALARIDRAQGKVFVEGEYWNAISDTPIEPGQRVEIVAIDGLTLKVRPQP